MRRFDAAHQVVNLAADDDAGVDVCNIYAADWVDMQSSSDNTKANAVGLKGAELKEYLAHHRQLGVVGKGS